MSPSGGTTTVVDHPITWSPVKRAFSSSRAKQRWLEVWPGVVMARRVQPGPVTEPKPFLRAYYDHRLRREAQILGVLGRGPTTVDQLVGDVYVGLDAKLKRAAAASVLAHLLHLVHTGRAVSDGHPGFDSEFALGG